MIYVFPDPCLQLHDRDNCKVILTALSPLNYNFVKFVCLYCNFNFDVHNVHNVHLLLFICPLDALNKFYIVKDSGLVDSGKIFMLEMNSCVLFFPQT